MSVHVVPQTNWIRSLGYFELHRVSPSLFAVDLVRHRPAVFAQEGVCNVLYSPSYQNKPYQASATHYCNKDKT